MKIVEEPFIVSTFSYSPLISWLDWFELFVRALIVVVRIMITEVCRSFAQGLWGHWNNGAASGVRGLACLLCPFLSNWVPAIIYFLWAFLFGRKNNIFSFLSFITWQTSCSVVGGGFEWYCKQCFEWVFMTPNFVVWIVICYLSGFCWSRYITTQSCQFTNLVLILTGLTTRQCLCPCVSGIQLSWHSLSLVCVRGCRRTRADWARAGAGLVSVS